MTSGELWRALEAEAGLMSHDYDEPLVEDIRSWLALDSNAPIDTELDRQRISIERLVEVFFRAAAPYVEMWTDLLALFERAAATAGDQNLRITYRFDDGPVDLSFDLEHFREVAAVVERLQARFDLSSRDTANRLWELPYVFGDRSGDGARLPSGSDEVDHFATACWDREHSWPLILPPAPRDISPRLDALLAEAWALAETFLGGLRAISGDHASLMDLPWDDDRTVSCGATVATLRQIESDFWLPHVVVALTKGAAAVSPADTEQVAEHLDNVLEALRNRDPLLTEPRRRLEELLSLPVWKHRYELYSNWVCTRIVAALDDAGPIVHADDGAIRFAFSGTHLATFDGFAPRLHIWTELRTPLADPVGKGRKAAIQPDVTLLSDPITAGRSPLAVECKQYKKASAKAFAAALTDYAHGHPNARIVLVNYGPARAATVLGHVPDDVVPRTTVIGALRPGQLNELAAFEDEVRAAAGMERRSHALAPTTPKPGRLVLRWRSPPKDLDLHVWIGRDADEESHVWYESCGTLDEPLYCALDEDVTDGSRPEVVTFARWRETDYFVLVHNYSNDAPLANSQAEVVLERDGQTVVLRCPGELVGRVWRVAAIDGRTGELSPDVDPTLMNLLASPKGHAS